MIRVKSMSIAESALVERRIIAAAIESSLEDMMAQDPDSLKVACAIAARFRETGLVGVQVTGLGISGLQVSAKSTYVGIKAFFKAFNAQHERRRIVNV